MNSIAKNKIIKKNELVPKQQNKISKNNQRKFDIGLQILRVIICYFVIIAHFYNGHNSTIIFRHIIALFRTHVSVFFILAFYFSYSTIISSNTLKLCERLKRLIIPYFSWPIIIWILNKFLPKDYKLSKCMSVEDLKYQLLYGVRFLSIFWFQWNLIMITIIFYLVFILFRQSSNFILIIIGIFSFIYQYNGHNVLRFGAKIFEKKFTFGRMLEMYPMGMIGYLFAFTQILNYFKKFRIKTFFVSILLIYFFQYHFVFMSVGGFGNQGIQRVIISILLFILFAMFPSESIKNEKLLYFIKVATNYTACVYYLHFVIPNYCRNFIPYNRKGTAFNCMIIYLICYLLGMIGSYIFKKSSLIYLFQ